MKISLVIPVFNEEQSVGLLYEKINQQDFPTESYEIIFVNDGSTDGTLNAVKKYSGVTVITHAVRRGKSCALQSGFEQASGEIIITLDGDLQDDPAEIPRFVREIEKGADMVCGWKRRRNDPVSKKIISRIANSIVRFLTPLRIHDINCGFKAYRKEVPKNLFLTGDMYRFIPLIAAHMGYRVEEIEVVHNPRKFGVSKYGIGRLFNSVFDFISYLLFHFFTHRPMYFFGLFGMMSSGIGSCILVYMTYLRIIMDEQIGSRPLFMLGVLLVLFGLQLFSLGFLGDLVLRRTRNIAEEKTKKDVWHG